jgi:hypothetical protein
LFFLFKFNGGSSKRKEENEENTPPVKKQKLSDAEVIEYEVIIVFII